MKLWTYPRKSNSDCKDKRITNLCLSQQIIIQSYLIIQEELPNQWTNRCVFQRRHGGGERCDRARLPQCSGAYKRQPFRQLREEYTEWRRPSTRQTVRGWLVLADQQRETQGVLRHVRYRHRCPDHEGSGYTGRFTRWKLSVGLSISIGGPFRRFLTSRNDDYKSCFSLLGKRS